MSPTYTPGDSYDFVPVPTFLKPTHTYGSTFGDEFHAPAVLELLASTTGWRQRGVVLAGGQGILPTGTVLGFSTSQEAYVVYKSTNTDGSQVALGFLRNGVNTNAGTNGAAQATGGVMVDRGVVFSAVTSGLDSNAITNLNGRVDAAVGLFYF